MKLQTTEKISGAQETELNQLLKNYEIVKLKLDDLTKQKNELAEQIKAICDHKAVYETRKYLLKINSRKGNDIFDKSLLKTKYPEIFEEFNTVNNNYSLVMGDITRK